MTEVRLEPETISPLLLELARALRARQFYPPTHPALRDTLERATAVWRDGLGQVQELHLELRNGVLVLPDGTPTRGPAIDEIAKALRLRRVRTLRIHRDLEARELLALIDALAESADVQEASGGLEQALSRAGVRHITTSEIEFGEHFARARKGAGAGEEEEPEGEEEEPEGECGEGEVPQEPPVREAPPVLDPTPPETPSTSPEKLRSESISELIKLLAELEKCDELSQYQALANRIEERVAAMTEAKNVVDGYRAVLVCCRHASDVGGRSAEIRADAQDRLQRLVENQGMLDLVIDHACSGAGLSSVQATQALICLGASVVPYLLERHERASAVLQSQLTAVLIAMGETAFPVILEQLETATPDRVRRAARLLGRMQHPGAADFLLKKLLEPDEELQREAARALARIGTDRAVQGLLQASRTLPELTSVVTACLGETRSEAAVPVLAQILDPSHKYPEHEQREAIHSLGRIRNPNALRPLKQVMERRSFFRRRRNRMLRIAAARAIGRIGGKDASALLAAYTEGGDPAVRKACRESLERMARAETP
jgi:hypothetical protein